MKLIGDNMNKLVKNKITKEEFYKLDEKDLMFITNPGRMGDEDGVTFVIKSDNNYTIYRIDGWMYRKNINQDYISLEDVSKVFPKWRETWKNSNNENYHGKYTYLYMGFGNGLCVDNSIYNEFKPYLDREVEEYLEREEDKEALKYAAIYNTWEDAFISMMENRK